jgi:hypothetical protein
MQRRRRRGFVVVELLVAVATLSVLGSLERSVETELDRLCVGAAPRSNAAPQPRIVTDVRRWVCVSVSSEPPENLYASRNADTRTSR